ncbi:MAG TPA: hypothetical protein VM451_02545 [Candidatus Limnocylindria bacterium]|nr:hypothetical protein [Candidatus Limnocylindria bacterium]
MQPRPADTSTGPSMPAGSSEPAEGRPDLGLPGADRQDVPSDRNEDLPEKLGQRIENGSSSGIATGEPDVLPDVEVPEATM